MQITALHNQSFLDISIQHTGSVYNAFEIAKANGCAISDMPISGTEYIIPETVQNDNDVLNYFSSKKLQPATAITAPQFSGQEPQQDLEGIDYWAIYDDFIIQ